MKLNKLLTSILLAVVTLPALAAWQVVSSETNGGTIYIETSLIQRGNGFLRAWMYTDYAGAINSDRVCVPSGADCQWKRLNTMVLYDWGCNNVVRLVDERTEWDGGPVSESYDPRRSGYNIPATPRVYVPKPGPQTPGGSYSLVGEQALQRVQAEVCRYWR